MQRARRKGTWHLGARQGHRGSLYLGRVSSPPPVKARAFRIRKVPRGRETRKKAQSPGWSAKPAGNAIQVSRPPPTLYSPAWPPLGLHADFHFMDPEGRRTGQSRGTSGPSPTLTRIDGGSFLDRAPRLGAPSPTRTAGGGWARVSLDSHSPVTMLCSTAMACQWQ